MEKALVQAGERFEIEGLHNLFFYRITSHNINLTKLTGVKNTGIINYVNQIDIFSSEAVI